MSDQLFELPGRQPWEDYDAPDRPVSRKPKEFLGGPEDRANERARARNSDPQESHQAAASVTNLTDKQNAIRDCLRAAERPLSDQEIAARYSELQEQYDWPQQSDSGLRTRRSELVAKGLVEKAGTTKLSTGRAAATWRVVS